MKKMRPAISSSLKSKRCKTKFQDCDKKLFIPEIPGEITNYRRLKELTLYYIRVEKKTPELQPKLDLPSIKKFKMKLFDERISEEDIENLAKKEIHEITDSGAMECLNSFKKGFEKIEELSISLNNWILVQKTRDRFSGIYLNNEFVEINLRGMTETIQTLELYECGDKKLALQVGPNFIG